MSATYKVQYNPQISMATRQYIADNFIACMSGSDSDLYDLDCIIEDIMDDDEHIANISPEDWSTLRDLNETHQIGYLEF